MYEIGEMLHSFCASMNHAVYIAASLHFFERVSRFCSGWVSMFDAFFRSDDLRFESSGFFSRRGPRSASQQFFDVYVIIQGMFLDHGIARRYIFYPPKIHRLED